MFVHFEQLQTKIKLINQYKKQKKKDFNRKKAQSNYSNPRLKNSQIFKRIFKETNKLQ
jgi:hypothetical protein